MNSNLSGSGLCQSFCLAGMGFLRKIGSFSIHQDFIENSICCQTQLNALQNVARPGKPRRYSTDISLGLLGTACRSQTIDVRIA